MELLQLRYFLALSKTENMSHTAKSLYISPPSLSLTISKLEKELGLSLFDRIGNKIKLNENGILFAECIENILNKLDSTINTLVEKENGKNIVLSVATTSPNIWNDLFIAFNKEFSNIVIIQNVLPLNNLNTQDLDNKYNFIITSPLDWDFTNKVNTEMIYSDDYPVLLVSKTHPLAKKNKIKFKDVKNENFIALTKGFSSRKLFDDFCLLAGVKPNIVLECDYIMRSKMIQHNVGIAMATARVRMDSDYANIKVINITEPKIKREQALFWSKRRKLSTSAILFKNFIQNYFKKYPIKNL